MASDPYNGYSPQAAEIPSNWPNGNIAQLQDASSSNPAIRDPAHDDLAYKPLPRGTSFNNPPPDGWLYPHKKGIGSGSNLEPFRAEIEARTQRGENCKAIAAALNAMGVQTSDRAISRVRIRWGMRKRAQRKVKTPPPDSDAARLSAKSKVQAMRKAELIRMTKDGMSPEEIYQSLTSRGMELKKGVATVLRLQSAWGVARDEKRWLGNFRHQCHKKAKAQQSDAFRDIARELGVQDIDGWVQEKMREHGARQARHELALKLMGEHAPTNPERRKLQKPRRPKGPHMDVHGTDAPDGSEDESSDDESESEPDVSGDVTSVRFGVIDSARQGDHAANNDGSLPSEGQRGVQPHASKDLSYVDGGVESSAYREFAPLNDYPEDGIDTYEAVDDSHAAASIASRVSEHLGNSLSQSTSGSRMQQSQTSQSHEMLASTPPPPHPHGSYPWPQSPETRATETASATTPVLPPSRKKDDDARQSTTTSSPASSLVAQLAPMQTYSTVGPQPYSDHASSLAQFAGSGAKQPTASVAAPTSASTGAPGLVLRPEEAEANKSTLSTLDQYNAAAKVYKELLEARNSNKPLSGSLTGMPPSAKEVESAKSKLKEATQAMMLALD
ncbi:hypothetical protein J7T55_010487 [Diaporthe amygdali]|uniref:uncharacterized protein n=1 Tax=Phomopsis amygdali TaxID=1214568 RepID=UPI0022FDF8C2|nr:uncharacterized protein J7T55_010487 [Diaporthe amygdali]KAJ0115664.1 hypothetical protein J7T55_010487 [Diaporthe amygdali]